MSDATRFWNRIADKYAKQPVANEDAYRHKLALTQKYLTPEMDLLEFGCGTGSTALEHAPHVRSVLATDIAPRMIEIAREKAAKAEVSNVRFEATTLEGVEAAPASFDMVLGLNILHLLDDWPQHIRKAHDLLKPGGLLVTSTACLADTHGWLRFVIPILRLTGFAPPVVFFTAKRFKDEMAACGFEIIEEYRPKSSLFLIARKT